MKKPVLAIIFTVIGLILAVAYLRFFVGGSEDSWMCVDGEWVKHGNPAAEKPTSGCGEEEANANTNVNANTNASSTTSEDTGNVEEKVDLIKVTTPQPNQKVTSPLTIQGEARGNWYFEAVFPIKIVDAQEKTLGAATGRAQADWMTSDFVPFEAVLEFSSSETTQGTLILNNGNPSGLPENAEELRIPVKF